MFKRVGGRASGWVDGLAGGRASGWVDGLAGGWTG